MPGSIPDAMLPFFQTCDWHEEYSSSWVPVGWVRVSSNYQNGDLSCFLWGNHILSFKFSHFFVHPPYTHSGSFVSPFPGMRLHLWVLDGMIIILMLRWWLPFERQTCWPPPHWLSLQKVASVKIPCWKSATPTVECWNSPYTWMLP